MSELAPVGKRDGGGKRLAVKVRIRAASMPAKTAATRMAASDAFHAGHFLRAR